MGSCLSSIEEEANVKKTMVNLVKGIKSSYIIEIIFLNLNENKKLNLIRHNNHFQKILSINIEHYMKMSGRYKVEGINGKGKEYEIVTDNLLFEGEYLNGKRNGKGKEYKNNGDIIFEGEYLNGKRHGKGKEFNLFNKVIFEGEYIKGKRWNGNFINRQSSPSNINDKNKNKNKDENIILYEIKNGKGIIKEYNDDRLIFEGEYLNGELNGKGKEYFHYGFYDRDARDALIMIYRGKIILFEGEYLNGKRWNGKGFDKKNNTVCEIKNGKGNIKEYNNKSGNLMSEYEILNGEKNGKCKIYRNEKLELEFEGIYFNGKLWNGKEYDDNNNLIYEGEYLNNKRWKGKFKEYNSNNRLLSEGEYLNGKKWNEKGYDNEGNVLSEIKNGEKNFEIKIKDYNEIKIIYENNYLNKKGYKKGKEYNNSNELLYEGEFLNGERNGKGKEYDYDGSLIYEGEFLDGIKNGKGKKYYEGKLKFEGEFKNGEIWNGYGIDGLFEGEFKNGKIYNTKPNSKNGIVKNGEGYVKIFDRSNDLIFEGEYKNGEKNGKGKEYFNNRLEFEGEFKNGEKVKGKQYSFNRGYDGRLEYEGEFLFGRKNGQGKEYDVEGNLIFEGEFQSDERLNGKLKRYDDNNQLISEELYINGEIEENEESN